MDSDVSRQVENFENYESSLQARIRLGNDLKMNILNLKITSHERLF
jgi:hypothetical protein